jgi:hypothetical protein
MLAYPPLMTGSPVGHEAATVAVVPPTPTLTPIKAAVVVVVTKVDTVRV